jgi:phosphoserine phosphatase RsbU/P
MASLSEPCLFFFLEFAAFSFIILLRLGGVRNQTFPLDLDALLLVLNYLNMGVYLTDRDRRILLWNRKAEEITSYPAKDVVGKACHQNVLCHADKDGHPLCSSGFCPLYRSILTSRESKEPVLVFAQSASGKRVPMSVSVAPLHDQEGNVIGGIETFRDETQNVQDLEFSRRIQRNLLPKSAMLASSSFFRLEA